MRRFESCRGRPRRISTTSKSRLAAGLERDSFSRSWVAGAATELRENRRGRALRQATLTVPPLRMPTAAWARADRRPARASAGGRGQDDLVAAGPLGLVERAVGRLERGVNDASVPRAHPALTVTAIVWSVTVANGVAPTTSAHVLGQGACLGLVEPDAGHEELLAAPPGERDAVARRRRAAARQRCCRTTSPTAWPYVSLTTLKWSTSTMITATSASGPCVADELVDRRFDAPAVAEPGQGVGGAQLVHLAGLAGERVLLGLGPQRHGRPAPSARPARTACAGSPARRARGRRRRRRRRCGR